ncbi:hypothetical protein WR164_15970 [Philodulcilactobacillus myokoensis]|uniref:Uncharacterized protein n=1 Tax=Philodulcilactobacillus myokoensis TaxID=2929573 RepID=A0A9W6EU56_9LACO|nr:hypothetical protein [Philodulcilactobacillus myokoensis]GLB47618.1 hypothetical protein WR164_15970 [Philodulcilactobacillus myokoensis]
MGSIITIYIGIFIICILFGTSLTYYDINKQNHSKNVSKMNVILKSFPHGFKIGLIMIIVIIVLSVIFSLIFNQSTIMY